jgi:hypothetical protein
LRGYYPGEREHRERPQPRVRRPRIPDPRGRDLHLPRVSLPRPDVSLPRLPTVSLPRPRRRAAAERRPGHRIDWALGIVLGVVLGILVVVAFLLFGSEGTIDAPSIHGVDNSTPPARQAQPLSPAKE